MAGIQHSIVDAAQAAASKPLVQALPSVTMIGNEIVSTLFDVTLPRAATVLGVIVLLAQLAYTVWKWYRESREPQ